ncbi:beta-aspartyl-peptidase [Sorangium sp. So ce131]|uniref:beta-aspartyl-peptidase n=1 Tax=Sorangium sp. So ce131 TaxID=3133282 RepID=UPI003F645872
MFVLIEGGEVYAPEPAGAASVLVAGDRIAKVGPVDGRALAALGLEVEVIDARGCVVIPGLIDPHEHLLGGSGERGFASQTPEIALREVVTAGITTVVGCLGVDTTTKTMTGLLAKAKAFKEEGISAYLYSGGYDVPPVTLTGSVRRDMLLVDEVIGAGEVAVSDLRSTEPSLAELARLASDAYVGGILTGKAGVTHLHMGDGPGRLEPVRRLLAEHDVAPGWLYPTHVERSEPLMREAIALTRQGVTVDIDTVEEDLGKWLRLFCDEGGDLANLTASSDASIPSPRTLFEQVREVVREHGFSLERVLPLVTSNTARILKLGRKGALRPGHDADVVVLERGSLEILEVVARGRRMVKAGRLAVTERFLEQSNRKVELHGRKYRER